MNIKCKHCSKTIQSTNDYFYKVKVYCNKACMIAQYKKEGWKQYEKLSPKSKTETCIKT